LQKQLYDTSEEEREGGYSKPMTEQPKKTKLGNNRQLASNFQQKIGQISHFAHAPAAQELPACLPTSSRTIKRLSQQYPAEPWRSQAKQV